MAQQCSKDSNYYSITYNGTNSNFISEGFGTSGNEVVALGQYSAFGGFVSKFTSDGSVIFSNEYNPDYPFTNYLQYPWYNNTKMQGMFLASDSTYYVFGYSFEHGRTVSGGEDPPSHWVGLLWHIDKFGNLINARYFGNWRTDYRLGTAMQMSNGNIVVYLRSFFFPYQSKVICINSKDDFVWVAPLTTTALYHELTEANCVMTQLKNGNIVIADEMQRDLDDTLIYPFTPPIIIRAPLKYFSLVEINGKTGAVIWNRSFQCPMQTGTNIPQDFIPQIKSITELPDGKLSLCADMYLADDSMIFYKHYSFSKRAVNFITNEYGYFLKMVSYRTQNNACSLDDVWTTGNNGEQILLVKDAANQNFSLFQIDAAGQVQWTKSYKNISGGDDSRGTLVPKANQKGFFIFQTKPYVANFHLNITNAIGNIPCTQSSETIIAEDQPWPWFVEKVSFKDLPANIDFRYSPFSIATKPHPLYRQEDCSYQYICCKDVIDSLNPHNISLCETDSYTLPDNTIVKESGTYYINLKTQAGCDSIVYYNIKKVKSPDALTTSPDTCLSNAASIVLRAAGGYDRYEWNGIPTNDSLFTVNRTGDYTVKVSNVCGSKTDTIHVYDQCLFPIYFPTAFTPNGDGLNDLLRFPRANKNRLVRLSIYNRWGQLVFYTETPTTGWDGKVQGQIQPAGVYVYFLEMKSFSGEKINQKGTVVLIR